MNVNIRMTTLLAGSLALSMGTPALADSPFGKWELKSSVETRSEFIPDSEAPTNRYGSWALIDAQFDKQWLANGSRTTPIGNREVKRTLTSDKLTYGANFTGRTKSYDAQKASVEYRNEYNKEELMGTDNYKSLSGSYAYTLQNFRIDNHKDKYILKPYTSTFNYDETLKHTYNFDITNEAITRVYFKDAISNLETSADLVEYLPDTVVTETGYAETGKKLTYGTALAHEAPRVNSAEAVKLAATGVDTEGPFHQVAQGTKQQRVIGETLKRNDMISSAITENASDKVLNSNTQVGGKASAKVTYSGMETYKAQGLDTVKESAKTVTVEEKKDKVGKAYSDSVDKLKDEIGKVADKPSSKKIRDLLESISDAYKSADSQDKRDYLKQAVAVALAETPLSASAQQKIQTILAGQTANSGSTTIAQSVDPVSKNDKGSSGNNDSSNNKADPLEVLLNNLGIKNRDLVYYLGQARLASDPLAYLKKAAAYAKSDDDTNAINAILDEQLNKAKGKKNNTLIKGLEDFKVQRGKSKK